MKHQDKKIILVDEEPAESYKQAASFLESNNYAIKSSSENSETDYSLEAHNKNKRFWKLFTSNKPQILKLLFKTSPDKEEQTEIHIKYEYFKYFFSKIYLLIILSLGLYHLAFSSFVTALESPGTDPIVFMIAMVLGMTLFVVYTMLFFSNLLLGVYDFDDFLRKLYNSISANYFEKYHSRSPRQKIVLIASISGIILLLMPYLIDVLTFQNIFTKIIIVLLGIAFIFLILLYRLFHSNVLRRILFLTHVLNGVLAVTVYLHILTLTGLIYKSFEQQGLLLSEATQIMFQEQVFMPAKAHFSIAIFLMSPFLIFGVFIVIFYSRLFQKLYSLKAELKDFKKDQRIFDSSNALVYRTVSKDNLFFSIITSLLWFIFNIAIITGLVFSFGFLEYALIGNNYLFNFGFLNFIITELQALYVFIFHKTSLYTNLLLFRFFLLAYLLPVLFLVVMQLIPNIRRFTKVRAVLKHCKTDKNIQATLERIASANNIQTPEHRITDEPGIVVKSLYVGIPFKKNYILLSKPTLDGLNNKELEGILAHEICHIKKHTFIFRLLNLLSEWTLLGKGFLITLLNPVQLEFESDNFAVSWLKKQNIDKESYSKVLRKIEVSKVRTMFANPISGLGIAENIINPSGKKGFIQKLYILLDLYFGDEILSYVYPTTEERIKRIKESENAN